MAKPSIAIVLARAADLIEPSGKWVRDWTARATDPKDPSLSYATNAADPAADRWGGLGAIYCVGLKAGLSNAECWEAQSVAARTVGMKRFTDWAWAPGREQREVVDALRRAAALAGGA